MSSLNFYQLRVANEKRLPEFKNAKGETAHAMADGSDWSPADWLTAVVGELGEYANNMKKVKRGDFSLNEARQKIAHELADVVIYLDILAKQLDIDLGAAIVEKFNIVSERVGSSVRICPNTGTVFKNLGNPAEC